MKCTRARAWMEIAGPEELNPQRRRRLQRHLDRCESCRQEMNRIQRAWEKIRPCLPGSPMLEKDLSAGILKAVNSGPVKTPALLPANWSPRFKLAACAFMIWIAAGLMQEAWVWFQVSTLETRMKSPSPPDARAVLSAALKKHAEIGADELGADEMTRIIAVLEKTEGRLLAGSGQWIMQIRRDKNRDWVRLIEKTLSSMNGLRE